MWGNISPRVASVRSNSGETSGSRLLQRQKDALMVPNPERGLTGGTHFQRDLWKAGVCGKDFPKSSPREDSQEGRISRETSGRLAYVRKISPRVARERTHRGDAFPERPLEGWRMWERFLQE